MSIIEVNWLLVTWKTVYGIMMSIGDDFLRSYLKIWLLRRLKINKVLQFVYKIELKEIKIIY